jgi:hypothetical protein
MSATLFDWLEQSDGQFAGREIPEAFVFASSGWCEHKKPGRDFSLPGKVDLSESLLDSPQFPTQNLNSRQRDSEECNS